MINKEVKDRLTQDYKEQVEWDQLVTDIGLCSKMAEITSSNEVLALTTRILQYIEALEELKSFYENLTALTKSKAGTLTEYHRLAKERIKQLAIIEHEGRK